MKNLYEIVIEHPKGNIRLYTEAQDAEEAGDKFNRYLVCQWIGYPWGDDSEAFLSGIIDKLTDRDMIQ